MVDFLEGVMDMNMYSTVRLLMNVMKMKLRTRMDLVFGIPSSMGLWRQLIVLKEIFIWTLEKMEMMIIGSSIIKKV